MSPSRWHLQEVLSPRVPVRRMVFHEITRAAIEEAVANSRELNRKLVDAQEARRILDRLFGWDVSEVLWKKVMPGLSAGRVQSVATRLVVERERARMAFRSGEYWDLEATFEAKGARFGATLSALDGRRLATGKDFDPLTGQLTAAAATTAVHLDEAGARGLAERLTGADFSVASVESKDWKQSPHAPFMTSTLQQEAGRKLRYGRGPHHVAGPEALRAGLHHLHADRLHHPLGAGRVRRPGRDPGALRRRPDAGPTSALRPKVKNAQEAHEAIRPAGDRFRGPGGRGPGARFRRGPALRPDLEALRRLPDGRRPGPAGLGPHQRPLHAPGAGSAPGQEATFSATGRTIKFAGFLRAYVEGSDDPQAELEDKEVRLPDLAQGEPVACADLEAADHFTQSPVPLHRSGLVGELEARGIGRPSTYASVIQTIQDRGYVWKKGSALVPSWTAFSVIRLLEEHFDKLVDYEFTARMEEDLDDIARGQRESVPWLRSFYFGNGARGPADHGGGAAPQHRRPLDQHDSHRRGRRRRRDRGAGRPLRPLSLPGRGDGGGARRGRPRRAQPRVGRRAAGQGPRRGTGCWARIRCRASPSP